jgi:hypothetical protein
MPPASWRPRGARRRSRPRLRPAGPASSGANDLKQRCRPSARLSVAGPPLGAAHGAPLMLRARASCTATRPDARRFGRPAQAIAVRARPPAHARRSALRVPSREAGRGHRRCRQGVQGPRSSMPGPTLGKPDRARLSSGALTACSRSLAAVACALRRLVRSPRRAASRRPRHRGSRVQPSSRRRSPVRDWRSRNRSGRPRVRA